MEMVIKGGTIGELKNAAKYNMNKINQNLTILVGITVFAYLVIIGLNKIIESVALDVNLIFNEKVLSIFWIIKIVSYLFTVLTFFYFMKWLDRSFKMENFSFNKTFYILFASFFIIQGVQFLYTYFCTGIVFENHFEKLNAYNNLWDQNLKFNYYNLFFEAAKYASLGAIILINRK